MPDLIGHLSDPTRRPLPLPPRHRVMSNLLTYNKLPD